MIDVTDKKIVVLGAARSGLAAAKLLHKKMANVFVSDSAEENKKQNEMQVLENHKISCDVRTHNLFYDAGFRES